MEINSDTYILNNTFKVGNIWEFKQLGFRAEMAGGRPFDQATSWCAAVRAEYERQESKRIAESVTANPQGRDNRTDDSDAYIGGDGSLAATLHQSVSQEEVQTSPLDAITKEVRRLELRVLNSKASIALCQARLSELCNLLAVDEEVLEAFQRTLETLHDRFGGPTEDVFSAVGEDIREEVYGGGEGSSGGVGYPDNPEGAPQETGTGS